VWTENIRCVFRVKPLIKLLSCLVVSIFFCFWSLLGNHYLGVTQQGYRQCKAALCDNPSSRCNNAAYTELLFFQWSLTSSWSVPVGTPERYKSTFNWGNYVVVFYLQFFLWKWFKLTLITYNSSRFTLRFFCLVSLLNWYLLSCRISKNESRLSRTCLRLSVAQRASSDERACLSRQPCKTGLISCTDDGNSCRFNCCRGNTPCKRLTRVLICPRYKDYRVSKQPEPRAVPFRELNLIAEYAKSHWWNSCCFCCCSYNGLNGSKITITSVFFSEVVSLAFQTDVSVWWQTKTNWRYFKWSCVSQVTFVSRAVPVSCKQANFFIFFNSECRAALGTSSSSEQGSLLHQVSVVSLSSGLFVFFVCLNDVFQLFSHTVRF